MQEINENMDTHVQDKELYFDSPFEEQVYSQLRNLEYFILLWQSNILGIYLWHKINKGTMSS